MTAENVRHFYEKFKHDSGKMQKELPHVVQGFMGLFGATMGEGALSVKTKELIALATGIVTRCEPCIYLHVEKCLKAGASREEILETAGVCAMMQGGPGFTYIPKIMDALEACGK